MVREGTDSYCSEEGLQTRLRDRGTMSAPMLRTMHKVAQGPQIRRTIVTRSMPRAGGHDDDHPHLVFDTAKAPFTKFSAGLIVGGGVFLGIGIVIGAVRHQQYKHGFWKKEE